MSSGVTGLQHLLSVTLEPGQMWEQGGTPQGTERPLEREAVAVTTLARDYKVVD